MENTLKGLVSLLPVVSMTVNGWMPNGISEGTVMTAVKDPLVRVIGLVKVMVFGPSCTPFTWVFVALLNPEPDIVMEAPRLPMSGERSIFASPNVENFGITPNIIGTIISALSDTPLISNG